MMFNPNQLQNYLTQYPSLSDAEVAALVNAPVLTPRTGMITYTAVGAILGAAKAITLRATLLGAVAQNGPLAPAAGYVDSLLGGPGFDASNADVQAMASQFVAAGVLTQADATLLLNTTSYVCGDLVQVADVTAARAAMAAEAAAALATATRNAACDAVGQAVSEATQSWFNDLLNPARSDSTKPIPTVGLLVTALQAIVAGGIA